MSLDRRTQRLEERAAPDSEPVTFVLHYHCPAEGGGTLIEARSMAPPEQMEGPRVRYYFEPEGGGEDERRELTKEEFDAMERAERTLPDNTPAK